MSTATTNPAFSSQYSIKAVPMGVGSQSLCDEGSIFIATNPTPGTPIATTTSVVDDAATQSSTHAQASPVMIIANNWAATDPNQKIIFPMYLKMLLSQVPTSATSWQYAIRLDSNPNKLTTAGTVITPVNSNSNSGTVSRGYINFGAITTVVASSNSRLVARGQVNSAVPVTADQWLFNFGNYGVPMDQISGGSGAKNISMPCGPIIIAPGWTLTLEMWGASNAAAPSWEFELGYVERPSGQ